MYSECSKHMMHLVERLLSRHLVHWIFSMYLECMEEHSAYLVRRVHLERG